MAFQVGTSPTTITSGGGAAQVTEDVFNAMWDNAMKKAQAAIANANEALLLIGSAPSAEAIDLDQSYIPPLPPTLPNDDPNNGEAIYDAKAAALKAMIEDGWANFLVTYFPDTGAYDRAIEWCDEAIQNGGSGVNTAVETALWQRGRARILADSERAEREAEDLWAGRRWPVPPGALLNQLQEIRLDAGRKLGEVNRDIAIKTFDVEIENTRFAIKTVVDQKKVALDATADYIRTLMTGPQVAMQLATGLQQLRSEMARNMVQLYTAQVNALDPKVRLSIADAQIKADLSKTNVQSQLATVAEKVRAAMRAVDILAAQSSAGLNAIGARASIQGNDNSTV